MKFSIIVPVYNVEKYLDKLMKSILDQTYKNYEVILVDDGSSDSSYSIMKKYSKRYNNIKSFHKNNEGPGLTRKYGFKKSSGDLLFFVDSDDYLPDKRELEKIINVIKTNDVDFVLYNSIEKPSNRISIPITRMKLEHGVHDVMELDNGALEGSLTSKIFKRELFDDSFFYDSNNYEDFYTTYMYLNNCNNFYYLNEIFYAFNRYEDNKSLTTNMNLNKFISSIDIILEISKKSKLKNSIKINAMNYYMYSVRMLFKTSAPLKIKRRLISKLKELKKIFRDNDLKICKKHFKKRGYYYYLITRIFV